MVASFASFHYGFEPFFCTNVFFPVANRTTENTAIVGGVIHPLRDINDRWYVLLGLFPRGWSYCETQQAVRGAPILERNLYQIKLLGAPELIMIPDQCDELYDLFTRANNSITPYHGVLFSIKYWRNLEGLIATLETKKVPWSVFNA